MLGWTNLLLQGLKDVKEIQASSEPCARAHIPNPYKWQPGQAGPHMPGQTAPHSLQHHISASACPAANSLETSVTSLLCAVCSPQDACTATQAGQQPWTWALFLGVEPCQATELRLGRVPAQWEDQDLALCFNSPPCLLRKVFSKSSSGYFVWSLAAEASKQGQSNMAAWCLIPAWVPAQSSWTTWAGTRMAAPKQNWTGSCSKLQKGRLSVYPVLSWLPKTAHIVLRARPKPLALFYRYLRGTQSYEEPWKPFITNSRVALRELCSTGRMVHLLCIIVYSYHQNKQFFIVKVDFFSYKPCSRNPSQQVFHAQKQNKAQTAQMRTNDTANCSVPMPDIGI